MKNSQETTAGNARVSLQSKPWEDYVYLFFAMWTLAGLGIDGYYHRNDPSLETFWSPWHGILYSGFMFNSAFAAWMVIRRRPFAPTLRASIPSGYELAAVGLIMFSLGGVGDAFWHEIFGVESSIDALLSPTHLFLLIGSMLGSTAPARAAWRRHTGRTVASGLKEFGPALLSVTFTASSLAFFFQYANGFDNWPMRVEFVPSETELYSGYGILSALSTTVILLGAALLLRRRWNPPFGAVTIMFGIVGFFMAGLDGFREPWQMLAPLASGLVADLLIRHRPHQKLLFGIAVPVTMWSTYTAAMATFDSVGWPPELWGGLIVMSGIVGCGLALLAFPPAIPSTVPEFDGSIDPGTVGVPLDDQPELV